MDKLQILNRFTGKVIFEAAASTMKELLVAALLTGANLRGADLRGADLRGADLGGANLRGANLHGADLRGADLYGADLYGADLGGANLRGADLGGANLRGADLYGADLRGADLGGANLPSPTVVLLANWGNVSSSLCRDLMVYNAACHPDPSAFARWANGESCPYFDVKVQRAAFFNEKREHWDATAVLRRPYDLMIEVLAEKCPPWTDEQQKAFKEKFDKK